MFLRLFTPLVNLRLGALGHGQKSEIVLTSSKCFFAKLSVGNPPKFQWQNVSGPGFFINITR